MSETTEDARIEARRAAREALAQYRAEHPDEILLSPTDDPTPLARFLDSLGLIPIRVQIGEGGGFTLYVTREDVRATLLSTIARAMALALGDDDLADELSGWPHGEGFRW